eukprot:1152808-Pelagomonas_calceolata.AAC.2
MCHGDVASSEYGRLLLILVKDHKHMNFAPISPALHSKEHGRLHLPVMPSCALTGDRGVSTLRLLIVPALSGPVPCDTNVHVSNARARSFFHANDTGVGQAKGGFGQAKGGFGQAEGEVQPAPSAGQGQPTSSTDGMQHQEHIPSGQGIPQDVLQRQHEEWFKGGGPTPHLTAVSSPVHCTLVSPSPKQLTSQLSAHSVCKSSLHHHSMVSPPGFEQIERPASFVLCLADHHNPQTQERKQCLSTCVHPILTLFGTRLCLVGNKYTSHSQDLPGTSGSVGRYFKSTSRPSLVYASATLLVAPSVISQELQHLWQELLRAAHEENQAALQWIYKDFMNRGLNEHRASSEHRNCTALTLDTGFLVKHNPCPQEHAPLQAIQEADGGGLPEPILQAAVQAGAVQPPTAAPETPASPDTGEGREPGPPPLPQSSPLSQTLEAHFPGAVAAAATSPSAAASGTTEAAAINEELQGTAPNQPVLHALVSPSLGQPKPGVMPPLPPVKVGLP